MRDGLSANAQVILLFDGPLLAGFRRSSRRVGTGREGIRAAHLHPLSTAEAMLMRFGYAFEQATGHRRPPDSAPPLR